MKKFILYSSIVCLIALTFSCSRNELDMDKFSGMVKVDQELAIPLIIGEITTSDIFNEFENNPLIVGTDTVKLIFGVDSISFVEDDGVEVRDTVEIREEPDTAAAAYELDYGELHYTLHNEFPVGVSCLMIFYDKEADIVLDTVNLNPGSGLFVEPAPVDEDGLVIRDDVTTFNEMIEFDKAMLDNITKIATHVIISAELIFEETGSVNSLRIPSECTVDFRFGLYAKGSYTTNLNSDN